MGAVGGKRDNVGRWWGRKLLWVGVWVLALGGAAKGEVWPLQNGENYYGELESYSFLTKELTLRKVDGKPFSFPARDLAFGAKTRLVFTGAFREALLGYRPPLLPVLASLLVLVVWVTVPVFMGLVGGAHILGTEASMGWHFRGFLKVMALLLVMGAGWAAISVMLDPGVPLMPDTKADLVLALTSLICGILFCSLLVALHYGRSFWKGMAMTLLGGVFSGILWMAGGLSLLYWSTRRGLETVVEQWVFEPLRWF